MDPFFLATSRFNRQRYDECVDICTQMLDKNPYDQAAWLLKCKALTKKSWVDDLEIDEEGVADILMGKYDALIRLIISVTFDAPKMTLLKFFPR